MGDPAFLESMKAQGLALFYQGPAAMEKTLMRDYESNARLVKQIGLTSQ